jgi:4'-phosphopantetheinyl transferase
MPPSALAPARAAGADVTVRLVDLLADDDAVARAEAVLSPAELARARRGTPEVHRRRMLLRAALRTAIAAELGTRPEGVPLTVSAAGRPQLPPGTGLDAGCSAAGPLGIVAVGRGVRVGVDVERVAPWTADVLDEGWLHPAEQQALLLLPERARGLAATRAWTQKEAVLKGRGTGLLGGPAAVVTAIGRAEGTMAGWSVRDVPVPDGWVAALAVAPDEETSP